uniref:Uncharacterized protein n=1 Tax=Fibrocapsa japonica TaxID=94617 RepID=A0A6U1NDJ1_9STRA|mmetsp:Transcript_20416/g.29544  ORF Transcript_20416/g.29544 Transcript_20416/m.29544 type:complete len:126 (+) Transcript_20416:82-459(+)
MLSAVRRSSALTQVTTAVVAPASHILGRFLAVDGKVPQDEEQQYGDRKYELEQEAKKEVAYVRDPVIPEPGQGTLANPILVPSAMKERAVGFEDPLSHQMQWFVLQEGDIHWVEEIDMYFKLIKS